MCQQAIALASLLSIPARVQQTVTTQVLGKAVADMSIPYDVEPGDKVFVPTIALGREFEVRQLLPVDDYSQAANAPATM